jgi:cyclic pyranopterin phosphate synthase
MPAPQDSFQRKVDYLRVSVTDRCNERCLYCMPEGYKGWQDRPDMLTAGELLKVVGSAVEIGFRKFRITGGEPLIRKDLLEIIHGMAGLRGMESMGLSTNGSRLKPMAGRLKQAGIQALNVSLDSLNADTYRRITGGNLSEVLAGIDAACEAGFRNIKLNCVLMRGVNEQDIWPLIHFAAEHHLILRFIELMPLTLGSVLSEENFLSVGEAMSIIRERDELIVEPKLNLGNGPAVYYRLKNRNVRVGFIGAITNLGFCEACNKMRLTADGKIRPCLGNHGEVDLKPALRAMSSETVEELFLQALRDKPLEHIFRANYQPQRPMIAIGG